MSIKLTLNKNAKTEKIMPISKYRQKRNMELKREALRLSEKEGMSLREVASIMKKSHEWVRNAIEEAKTEKKS